MKFNDMLKQDVNDYLYALNVIKVRPEEFEMSFDPDYDSTEYVKYIEKDYVFFDNENFKDSYESVIRCTLVDFGFISTDKETQIMLNAERDELNKNLGDKRIFKKVDILGIDNIQKTINFYGAFSGDTYTIGISSFNNIQPIAKCHLLYIPLSIKKREIYYQLLAESRLLLEEDKIKLAFFTAFSAFDMYINDQEVNRTLVVMKDGNIVNRRLEEKLKDIYKHALNKTDLGRDNIWGVLISEYGHLEDIRNDIAHGRDIVCEYDNYKKLILVISSFMIAIENSLDTFEEIYESEIR